MNEIEEALRKLITDPKMFYEAPYGENPQVKFRFRAYVLLLLAIPIPFIVLLRGVGFEKTLPALTFLGLGVACLRFRKKHPILVRLGRALLVITAIVSVGLIILNWPQIVTP